MLDILPILGVYTPSIGSTSNLYHIETVNYNSICVNYSGTSCKFFLQVILITTVWYLIKRTIFFYITGVYDLLYSAAHPMKYLESDVMRYKYRTYLGT